MAAQTHRECETPEGGCGCVEVGSSGGDGDRAHVDGFGGCDVGRQGAGGCGRHEHGWVKVSGGGRVSWRVDKGVVDEDGAVGRASGS